MFKFLIEYKEVLPSQGLFFISVESEKNLLYFYSSDSRIVMNKQVYSLASGTVLIAASLVFFLLPSLLNLDAFIPVMLAILAFLAGLGMFLTGHSAK